MFTTLRLMLIAVIVASSFAVAADARGRYHRHHRGGGFDVGDALIGGLIVGGIIALATSGRGSRSDRTATHVPPAPYPPADLPPLPPEETPADLDPEFSGMLEDQIRLADADYDRRFPAERAAVASCAAEAEALAGRYGGDTRLLSVDQVRREDIGFRVFGVVRVEDEIRADDRAFSCFADEGTGRVTGFEFEDVLAQR